MTKAELEQIYKVFDRNDVEMPRHHSGRLRNYGEAKKLVDRLNKIGEFAPYKMIKND